MPSQKVLIKILKHSGNVILCFASIFKLIQFLLRFMQVLCFYAQFLSRSFKSVNSIKNYLSGVKLLHLYLDDDYPKFDEFQLKLTLKGLARINPHCLKQALPTTPQIWLRIFELLDI